MVKINGQQTQQELERRVAKALVIAERALIDYQGNGGAPVDELGFKDGFSMGLIGTPKPYFRGPDYQSSYKIGQSFATSHENRFMQELEGHLQVA